MEYGVNDKETTQDTRVRWAGINKIGYIIQIQCKENILKGQRCMAEIRERNSSSKNDHTCILLLQGWQDGY